MDKTRIHALICSTRPTRIGPTVGRWFIDIARQHDAVDTQLVDLAAFDLPIYDEPQHPRLRQYVHDHTKRWSASVEQADGFVFITPEYNYGPPPSLLNAMSYLVQEWSYKPVGFVSYGGISGGLRAVQMIKQTATTLRMLPVLEAVVIPSVQTQIKAGEFRGNELQASAVPTLLQELDRVARALAPLRQPA